MNLTHLSTEEREVIRECASRMAEIAALPKPPAWAWYDLRDWNTLREHGPRYKPTDWFGKGDQVMPEKYRVRYLRAVRRLHGAGIVTGATMRGRLAFVKLTPAGAKIAEALERKRKRGKESQCPRATVPDTEPASTSSEKEP